jgi:hypothetical protein
MTTRGWNSVAVRDETKEKIDRISEEEDMAIADVVHQSVGFVFDDFYEPEGPEVQVPEDRRKAFAEPGKSYTDPADFDL